MPELSLGKLEPELAPHYQAWKAAPTPANSGALLRAVNPTIETAVKSYGGKFSPTLKGKAKQLSLQAFGTYDPSRGTLKTHLLSQLQSLRRASAAEQNIISVPEAVRLDHNHLLESERTLADQLGRSPSDAEIGDHIGLTPKRLAYIRQYRGAIAEGATEQPQGDQEGREQPASEAVNKNPEEAWQNFIYNDLDDVDRTIMDLSLGRNGNPVTQGKEIAIRLGITGSAVSQRAAKIQKLLDSRYSTGSIL